VHYEATRVLIWAKTYPELSTRHLETVCTAAVREDGRPVRLYPVPLRYLEGRDQFKLYEWVTVPITKSTSDVRPESHKIDSTRIVRGEFVAPDPHGWAARRAVVFRDPSWQFANVDALLAAEKAHKTSFGIVAPGEIEGVKIVPKPPGEAEAYARRVDELQAQQDAFVTTYKELGYRPADVKLRWRCAERCRVCAKGPHDMQVLDWGLLELARKRGWDWAAAKARLEDILDPATHDVRLFLGNFKAHPKNFGVIGMWYPKHAKPPGAARPAASRALAQQPSLFDV
jgi:hypothetical protein